MAYCQMLKPNAKGTGNAVRIQLIPATENHEGALSVTLAHQDPIVSGENGGKIFPTFDWVESVRVSLTLADIAEILMVLRGMQESIAYDKGLYHRSSARSLVIRFAHHIEPCSGYLLTVWQRDNENKEVKEVRYDFSMSEAFTLMLSIERVIGYIAFGVPTCEYCNIHTSLDYIKSLYGKTDKCD